MNNESEQAPRAASESGELRSDATSRVIGMVVGGGVGAFLLVFLGTYAGTPVEFIAGLPGIGVAIGMGLFSFRRSMPWGVLAAVVGYSWMVFVLWLRRPDELSLSEQALVVSFTIWGAPHVLLVMIVGYTVGAGWEKIPVEPTEEEED